MSRGLKIVLGIGAAFLVLIFLGSIGNSEKDKTPASSTATSSRASTGAPAPTGPVAGAPTTTEPPESRLTPAQKNAIKSAESYLDYSAFSKQGLIDQLEYGDFSTADATFAVEYVESNGGVDWNEQAVKSAESYLEYSSFSLQALIDQLEYSGFTPSEAQYGANKAYNG